MFAHNGHLFNLHSILELVRTHFSGRIPPRAWLKPLRRGEGPRKFGKAAACTERSRSEPHRSKPQKNPDKNIGSNHLLRNRQEANQNSLTFPTWCPRQESNPEYDVRSVA